MTTRRNFLRSAAALGLQGAMPVSLTSFAVAATVPPAAATAAATLMPSALPVAFVEGIADKLISGLDLQSGLFYLDVGQIFDDEEELASLWPDKAQQDLLNMDNEEDLDELLAALAHLPDDKKGEHLDELADDIFEKFGVKTALLNHLLIQPEDVLFAVQKHPEFIEEVVQCNDKIPEAGAYGFDHPVLECEISNNLMRILNLSQALASIRLPENGQSFNAPDYFCHIVNFGQAFETTPAGPVSRESFIAAVKDWLETSYLEYFGIRLGLYELDAKSLQEAVERETLLRQVDINIHNRHQASLERDIPTSERNFGSEEAFQAFLKNRKTNPALNRLIDEIAGNFYDKAVPVRIVTGPTHDATSINLYGRVALGASKILDEALAMVRASFPDADIQVAPSSTSSEPDVFEISYVDATGNAADFSAAFSAALEKARHQTEQVVSPNLVNNPSADPAAEL